MVGQRWAAWQLLDGWKSEGSDIGWAKSVALELAVLWVVEESLVDSEIKVRGDNTGVIGAFAKGHSRNVPRNNCICRIASLLIPHNITILPVYVPSAANRTDPVSHGILGLPHHRLNCSFKLPDELSTFLHRV